MFTGGGVSFGPRPIIILVDEKSTWNHGTWHVWIMLVGIVERCFAITSEGKLDKICNAAWGDNPYIYIL